MYLQCENNQGSWCDRVEQCAIIIISTAVFPNDLNLITSHLLFWSNLAVVELSRPFL